jgi:hypothetical protein
MKRRIRIRLFIKQKQNNKHRDEWREEQNSLNKQLGRSERFE